MDWINGCACLQIPYFNAPIFLQNKTQIGRIEEIFGGINNSVSSCLQLPHALPPACASGPEQALTVPTLLQFFTIKMQEGIVATSYANGDKFFIDPMKLLPLDRFLPKPKGAGVQKGGGCAL